MSDFSTIAYSILLIPLYFITTWLWRKLVYLHKLWIINKAIKKFATVDYHWLYGHAKYLNVPPMNEEAILKLLDLTNKSEVGAAALVIPPFSVLFVCMPKTIRQVVNANPPKGALPASGEGYKFFEPWLGDALALSNGSQWSRDRKLLDLAFHQNILKGNIKIYNDSIRDLIDIITSKISTNELASIDMSSTNEAASIDICPLVNLFTLEITIKSIFSIDDEDIQRKGTDSFFLSTITEICALLLKRIYQPHMWGDWLYFRTKDGKRFLELSKASKAKAKMIIQKRREMLRNQEGNEGNVKHTERHNKHPVLLDILLLSKDENGKAFSDEEIANQVQSFIFGGYDTTSSVICWTLYNLARHPDIQQRARNEVDDVLGAGDTEVEWDHLHQFEYLTRCIKESMRLHPPVTNIRRELMEPLIIGGNEVPAGAVIDMAIYSLHHNPRVWGDNHMEYIPDRFLPENISKMNPCSFIPFSFGARNCIGQHFAMHELKTTIATLLHQFEFKVDESHPVKMLSELVLRPEHGIKLFISQREK